MKVYKSLYTRIQYSIYLWTQDADVDLVKIHGLTCMKYLGICTSLVTIHAPWVVHSMAVGQRESTEFMTSQWPGTKHYVPIHIPACHTSIKQNKYL